MFCILKEQALDLQFSSGRTVEAPIVFIFNVPVKFIQLFPQFWVGELLDVRQYPRFIASEILVKPIIDCREDQFVIVCESNPTGMIDEGSCSRIEQGGSVFRSEGDLFQIWASETGAADRIMQPWVTPDRTQNPMLNVVQRDGFAFDLQQLFICKTNFMHSFRLVRGDVFLEKTGPRFMINLQRAGGVVLLPTQPEVGLGGRRSQKWHNDQK